MDGNCFNPDSSFLHNKGGGGGVDRISELPDEIIIVIVSFLSLREAARTSTLSSRWLDLWKHNPDRISQLPDRIIAVILSLLPLREAACTSVLSSRWLDLWKHTPNLNFITDTLHFDYDTIFNMSFVQTGSPRSWDADRCKYFHLVNSVLQSHKAPSVKQFTASFYVNKLAHLKVAKWLEFVFSRGVETLELDFQCRYPNYQVVLEELLMIVSGLSQTDDHVISFSSLKSLRLRKLVVSGEVIKMLLCNCPSLEELDISVSTLTSDVEVCSATLALKRLEIYFSKGNKSIKVSAPNLILLKVGDGSKLLLENVPKLVEAHVAFLSSYPYVVQNFASAVFCFSSQLKTLYLTLLRPEIFLANGFSPQMPNLNKLVLDYGRGEMQSLLPITALIWACPRLEEFKLMFTKTEIIGGAAVQVARDAERSPHRHLKLFELTGFKDGAVHHVELVNYIVDNCVSLEKIIIRPTPSSMKSYFKNKYVEELQAAIDYAKQQLQGIIPQHIQLAI